jgi:antitoxin (DNA-binding transcriptional repressor) of toxin-antitoxin stability system
MKKISATMLARQLGDVLGRIRYRGESFEVERNGVIVARIEPARSADPGFAEALERVGAADREPRNPWAS